MMKQEAAKGTVACAGGCVWHLMPVSPFVTQSFIHRFSICDEFAMLTQSAISRIAPLRSDARIRQAADQVRQRLSIAHEWSHVVGSFWCEDGGKLRQHAMRKSGILMMHAVVRFVKQRVSKQMAEPALRHNASGRAIHGIAGQANVFDVFAPALKICRYQSRDQIHQEEIFPHPQKRDRAQNASPDNNRECKLSPNSPSHLVAAD